MKNNCSIGILSKFYGVLNMSDYVSKNYEHLKGINGLSDKLLETHFTLYNGYVTNTNKLSALISSMLKEGKASTPEFAEIKRRFGWEFNGMRLHELYFDQMSKSPSLSNEKSALYKKIVEDFGSFDAFLNEFKSVGAMRGIGWVVLYYDLYHKRLFVTWVNEHDAGHLSSCAPILIMDVFEHAFIIDYGTKRADYISTFFNVLNYKEIESRFDKVNI